ncbi:MAG TPA: 4-(cytidine 5'-diphospho)-2-C-methyl-D-erythritol kinase [Pyrinomonadaceae bacterium]|nr:4-(cytidine 5'-diphospho)-2-C-methyl-D-erythritol kinase [Pyrinomonadaceae bacterium]
MSETKITLPAYAKINLVLRVLGRRADGYHEIETVFQTISLHDLLTFEPLEDGRIELVSTDPEIPSDETNLVHRAAVALREFAGERTLGARMTLEKHIPSQAGLGGGSSDAAAALCSLASLWDVAVSKRELVELAARLGADVPFFLTGGTAAGTGLGTDIRPLEDAPKLSLVVVTPGVKVSTAEAYKLLNAPALTKAEADAKLPISRAGLDFSGSLRGVMRNDFEPVVFPLEPEIARARDALTAAGAEAAMLSGSGSSVFGVFENPFAASAAARALTIESRWQVFECETVGRAEYAERWGACAASLGDGGGSEDEIGA